MADCMQFPNDWQDFLSQYSFADDKQIYTNGSDLIPVFRAIQLIEHLLQERPKQVRGYWKKDSQFSSVFCSKCGFPAIEQYICDSIPPKQYLSEYCPWCGAKMDEKVTHDLCKGHKCPRQTEPPEAKQE